MAFVKFNMVSSLCHILILWTTGLDNVNAYV